MSPSQAEGGVCVEGVVSNPIWRAKGVFQRSLFFKFIFYFESMFIKVGDSETRKGLGQKEQQERA